MNQSKYSTLTALGYKGSINEMELAYYRVQRCDS